MLANRGSTIKVKMFAGIPKTQTTPGIPPNITHEYVVQIESSSGGPVEVNPLSPVKEAASVDDPFSILNVRASMDVGLGVF